MKKHSDPPLIGKWRITERELWDAEFIDLLGPSEIRFHLSYQFLLHRSAR
jgi:hypothetical protein